MAEEIPVKPKIRWRDSLRRDFLAGMLVFLPVAITLWFIGWMIDLLDSVLAVMPDAFHPNFYLPFAIPKLGALVTVLLILFLGILTRGVATRRFLAAWESVLVRIPIFRGIYSAVQKLVQTFFGQSQANRQVVMIEYPRVGVYTVGFAMGRAWGYLEEKKNCPAGQCLRADDAQPDRRLFSARADQSGDAAQYDHGRSAQADHLERPDYAGR